MLARRFAQKTVFFFQCKPTEVCRLFFTIEMPLLCDAKYYEKRGHRITMIINLLLKRSRKT